MKKKILITGASGFVGQLSIDYFKKKYSLILVDKRTLSVKNFFNIDITDYNKNTLITLFREKVAKL